VETTLFGRHVDAKPEVLADDDRGPYLADRIIDLSERAASELGIKEDGVARVKVELRRRSTLALAVSACIIVSAPGDAR
jgi:rare lipoprotein A